MTVQTAVAVSLLRCLAITMLALCPAAILSRTLRCAWRSGPGKLLLVFLAIPLLTPELLTGFVYRQVVAQISDQWLATEFLYSLIALIRTASIGAIVLWLQPASSISISSLHSAQLMLADPFRVRAARRVRLRLRAGDFARRLLPAISLMLIVAFQEFEIAALLQIDRHPIAWTVTLFDAHAGGEALWKSLSWTALPVSLELLMLLPVLLVLRRRRGQESDCDEACEKTTPSRLWACLWILLPVAVFLAYPVYSLMRDFVTGIVNLASHPAILIQALEQIGITLAVCGTAAIVATSFSFAVTDRLRRSPRRGVRLWLIPLLLPGLAGSLVISLMLVGLFQMPAVRLFYDTPLPQVLGLVLLMLPRCLLLGLLLDHTSPNSSRHSARLLGDSGDGGVLANYRNLLWRLVRGPRFWATCLVGFWCSWDVTTASLLRPAAMEPVVTRLYNEMHYQRNEYLTTVTLLAIVVPLLTAAVIRLGVRRLPWTSL